MRSVVVFSLLTLFAVSNALAEGVDCSRPAGSLPNPKVAAGTPNREIPIEHVLVIMQENHSFDRYFGHLNISGYEGEVDGLTPEMATPDKDGKSVPIYHESSLCVLDVGHNWNHMHGAWNGGRNDGFATKNSSRSMGYYTKADLPFYYSLANRFAIGDRYFASTMTQTFPNRFYLWTGTSFGHIRNDFPKKLTDFSQKTLFELLDEHKISWKYYSDGIGYIKLFASLRLKKISSLASYKSDLAKGTLPQVAFIESNEFAGEDEHPSANVQNGQAWVADKVNALISSSSWKKTVLFFTYDEGGGFYDHVPPPEACVPDDKAPMLKTGDVPGGFDRYGFRVPFIAISPWAKQHYVSHTVYDHTSILKFIETKFNLPALTKRDANANSMLDLFDFVSLPRLEPVKLAKARKNLIKSVICGKPKPEEEEKESIASFK